MQEPLQVGAEVTVAEGVFLGRTTLAKVERNSLCVQERCMADRVSAQVVSKPPALRDPLITLSNSKTSPTNLNWLRSQVVLKVLKVRAYRLWPPAWRLPCPKPAKAMFCSWI